MDLTYTKMEKPFVPQGLLQSFASEKYTDTWSPNYRMANHLSTPNVLPSIAHTAAPSWAIDENSSEDMGATTFVDDFDDKMDEDPIEELKMEVSNLVQAISVGKCPAMERALGMEAAHRLLSRLKELREENERLAGLATGSKAAELEVELTLLLQENQELQRHVRQ